eukprot:178719-Amphidinium_carterae.1
MEESRKDRKMEESRKDLHYLLTTRTTGKERKEEKETRVSFATSVEYEDTQATNVGGTRRTSLQHGTTNTNM